MRDQRILFDCKELMIAGWAVKDEYSFQKIFKLYAPHPGSPAAASESGSVSIARGRLIVNWFEGLKRLGPTEEK